MTLWHLPEDGSGKNPYGQLLMRSLEARGIRVIPIAYRHMFALRALTDRPDVLHFQFIAPFVLPAGPSRSWWRAMLKGPVFLLQVGVLRLIGCRIIWTAHNLLNHERRLAGFEWFFNRIFITLAHHVIVHGAAARQAFIATYRIRRGADKVAVVFHPNYIGAYPDGVARDDARRRLGIGPDPVVILCLGQIRPYKGLLEVIRAFRTMTASRPAELWIAGEAVDPALAADLEREASGMRNVRLSIGYQSPDDVAGLLKASDVVALPYLSILTSGAAVLAMSCGKACVAPRLACLTEVLDGRGAFFYDQAESDGLSRALGRAVDSSADLAVMGQYNLSRASAWTWSNAAELLIELYAGTPPSTASRVPTPGLE